MNRKALTTIFLAIALFITGLVLATIVTEQVTDSWSTRTLSIEGRTYYWPMSKVGGMFMGFATVLIIVGILDTVDSS